MYCKLWLRLAWNDTDRLAWKPSKFDGFDTMTVEASKLWLPEIGLRQECARTE